MYSVLDQLLLPGEEAHIIERLSGKEMDFRSTITKIRQHQPEVLVVFLLAGQIAEFYRQLADQKLSIPTFGTNLFECRSEITRANGAMDGAIWANPLVSSQFQAQYLAKFGEQSQISWAALAYEFANLTSRIVETDPKITTGADLLFRLSQPSNYSGFAVGEFSAVNSSDIPYYRFKLTAKTVKNGEVIQTDVN